MNTHYQQGLDHIWNQGRIEDPAWAADEVIAEGRCEELSTKERQQLRAGLIDSAERHNARIEE